MISPWGKGCLESPQPSRHRASGHDQGTLRNTLFAKDWLPPTRQLAEHQAPAPGDATCSSTS